MRESIYPNSEKSAGMIAEQHNAALRRVVLASRELEAAERELESITEPESARRRLIVGGRSEADSAVELDGSA
jgi:hypothetical protein